MRLTPHVVSAARPKEEPYVLTDGTRRSREIGVSYSGMSSPRLGSRPIAAISPSELLMILKQIESNGFLDTARRVKQRCSRVFRHAIGLGCIQCDITEGFRGLLERPTSRHRPSIRDPQRLGGVAVCRGGIQKATDHGHCPETGPIAFRQTRRAPPRALARYRLCKRPGEF